jgi:hypothetical protein
MTTEHDQKYFRAEAHTMAISEIATILAHLMAPPYSGLHFETVQLLKLERDLMGLIANFIRKTPVVPLPPEYLALTRGTEKESHKLLVEGIRERLLGRASLSLYRRREQAH